VCTDKRRCAVLPLKRRGKVLERDCCHDIRVLDSHLLVTFERNKRTTQETPQFIEETLSSVLSQKAIVHNYDNETTANLMGIWP